MESRRFFIFGLLSFLLSLIGCSKPIGDAKANADNSGPADCTGGGIVDYINVTHAHTVVNLTPAEITAAIPGNYMLLDVGTAGHSHTFALTAQNFTDIQAGQAIQKTDIEGDGHLVQISC